MALESVTAAETLIQSNTDNDDLEDGEIPSDEDDEPIPPPVPSKSTTDSSKSSKADSHRDKNTDSKSSKNKSKSTSSSSTSNSKSDRFTKYKNPTEDWAGDVEKAIKAVLDEDKKREDKSKSKSSTSSRNKSRKRSRDDKEADDRAKEQKKRRVSEEENGNEDDDELLFIRGASPVRKENHDVSPISRRSHERDNFDNNRDSDRDSEERSSRHRDDKRSNNRSSTPRRSGKNERGGKNKSRANARSERNSRRNQSNQDHNQDPDSICVYFMQGKCHRGDDCPFSHNALPPRKMELCKFYLMDCCAKRDKCLYMHHDFPCKFFHTGLKCTAGTNCKFSHEPLNDQVKNILLKHLETAPKEILGDFPRLSRESALMMINNTSRGGNQGREGNSQKIPSLFEVTIPTMGVQTTNSLNDKEDDGSLSAGGDCQKRPNQGKDKKSAGKKTRWGSDDDRVPLEQIMLLQSVSQFGLNLPNVALSLAVQQQLQQRLLLQQCIANMEFYNEIQGNPSSDNNKVKEIESTGSDGSLRINSDNSMPKDIDLRQLLTNVGPKTGPTSVNDELGNSSMSKFDEESDREEESNLIIEVPVDDDEKNRDDDKRKNEIDRGTMNSDSMNKSDSETIDNYQESHTSLPKETQELFMRIQQQQRTADEHSIGNSNSNNNNDDDDEKTAMVSALKDQEEWYSDDSDNENNDDNDDDDDDEGGNLQIVIKDSHRDESERSDQDSPTKKPDNLSDVAEPSILIPQPAPIIDKLGDLSKIDISAEVTKLLSSIKPQSSKKISSGESSRESTDKTRSSRKSPDHTDKLSCIKPENDGSSPKSSPSTSSAPVSRDPRMSRDPRQRRIEDNKPSSPSISDSKKESRTLRLETSIYSSGITAMDTGMDTDLRARLDQDHRRKDMDLRQTYQDFGDTDLRLVGNNFEGSNSSRSDIDLRQMLTLPFKPAPTHVPCTEIDASIASHPQTQYKVYVVDIPRPNYTGLKLTKNDAAVKHDPRLRKIFRLSKSDIADSPMSPPPLIKQLDTPKSPPLHIRADPRRKTLEASGHAPTSTASSAAAINSIKSSVNDMQMNLSGSIIPAAGGLSMGINQNSMLGVNSLPSIMNPQLQQHPQGVPMAMTGMSGAIAPNGSSHQLGFDPRFVPRNGGPGLLGPAPGLGYPDVGPNYDPPPYSSNNFNNFGPGPNETIMPFGPSNAMNFCNNPPEWTPPTNPSPNPVVRNRGRVRRRNRNRSNANANRGNRSSPQ